MNGPPNDIYFTSPEPAKIPHEDVQRSLDLMVLKARVHDLEEAQLGTAQHTLHRDKEQPAQTSSVQMTDRSKFSQAG